MNRLCTLGSRKEIIQAAELDSAAHFDKRTAPPTTWMAHHDGRKQLADPTTESRAGECPPAISGLLPWIFPTEDASKMDISPNSHSRIAPRPMPGIRTCVYVFLVATYAFVFSPRVVGQIASSVYDQVIWEMNHKQYSRAEAELKAALTRYPDDAAALGLMGVVLDAQKRYSEAEVFYQHALRVSPPTSLLWNNLGNHYQVQRKEELARSAYQKVVQMNVHDASANFQLARICLAHGQGQAALVYLGHLRSEDQVAVAVQLLRAQAFESTGELPAAQAQLVELLKKSGEDPRVAASVGMLLAKWRSYRMAEEAFSQALNSAPTDFDLLHNLGLAALNAGDISVARNAFHLALNQRPNDVNCRKALAETEDLRGYEQEATSILWEPTRLAPGRTYLLKFLRKVAAVNPVDTHLQARFAAALLSDGDASEAEGVLREIKATTSDPKIFAECGRLLVEAQQYRFALEFLSEAGAGAYSEARLDFAIAVFHEQGPVNALSLLDENPPPKRDGDYFLLRAQLLDSMGKAEEAAEALNHAFRSSPERPDLYFQAALFLIKHQQFREAIALLTEAEKFVPDDPRLQLTRAISCEMLQRHTEAEELLTRMESRWPDWYLPHEVHGIVLSIAFHPDSAKTHLERAITLGANNAQTYFYLASDIITANDKDLERADDAILKAITLDAKDPYIQSLAGKIAYQKKDYAAATQHLNAALDIWPDMVEAHETLSAVYRALGEKDKSIQQLKDVLRIKQEMPTGNQVPPFPIGSELFAVR